MKNPLLLFMAILSYTALIKAQTIPDGQFESWNSTSYDEPDSSWSSSNSISVPLYGVITETKVQGIVGQAVHLQTKIIGSDTIFAFVTNEPGVPYSQKPTAVAGYFRCNTVGMDTGMLEIQFYKNGFPLQFIAVPFTGNVSSFTKFNVPISLTSQPDTVVIFISSSNTLNYVDINSGSWLEIDQLSFTGPGVTQKIPGGSFDNWTSNSYDVPIGWEVGFTGGASSGVSKSSDHYAGNYSAQLMTQSDSTPAGLTTGQFDNSGNSIGGLPYNLNRDTITGFYKYSSTGQDTGTIIATLMNGGSIFEVFDLKLPKVSNWTQFEFPIALQQTPDTMRLDIFSSIITNFSAPNIPGSTLLLDNLQLKSQPLSGIKLFNNSYPNISTFPDPASDILHIKYNQIFPSTLYLKIYDVAGQLISQTNYSSNNTLSVAVDQFKPGIYFYELVNNGTVYRARFIKR